MKDNVKNQNRTLYDYILNDLEQKRGLGIERLQNSNKLISLLTARKCGLLIPQTKVLTLKIQLKEFVVDKKNLITKSLQDVVFLRDKNNEVAINYTEKINANSLNYLPDVFAPSLFQEMIEKRAEIRTFYLDERCYSMAIFSQNDEQTQVDFRKYNDKKPNRKIPFKLPPSLEKK